MLNYTQEDTERSVNRHLTTLQPPNTHTYGVTKSDPKPENKAEDPLLRFDVALLDANRPGCNRVWTGLPVASDQEAVRSVVAFVKCGSGRSGAKGIWRTLM